MVILARVGRDGRRVLCGVQQSSHPKRFTCGGELGQLVWKNDGDEVLQPKSSPGDFWRFHDADGPLFYLASGFRFECKGTPQKPLEGFFRKTERPLKRTDKHLRFKLPDEPYPPEPLFYSVRRDYPIPWTYEWSYDAGQRLFGSERQGEEFELPIQILCPLCHCLNWVTSALLKSAPTPR